jgi:hypothetical protein
MKMKGFMLWWQPWMSNAPTREGRSLEDVLMDRLGSSTVILLKILSTSLNNSIEGRVSSITK